MRIALTIVALTLTAAPLLAQPKPVDASVQQVLDRRSNGPFADCTITVALAGIKSSEVEASRVVVQKATDDTGQDLVDREKQEQTELDPNFAGSMRDANAPATVGVTLKNPSRKAKKITEVRGEIELFMPSKDPNSVAEIPKFMTFTGKPLANKALKANGIEITFMNAAQIEAENKKRAESGGFSVNPEGELAARLKDPNKRMQSVVYVDAAGDVKRVMTRDDDGVEIFVYWGDKPQPDWKLRVNMKTTKNVIKHTFALKDVALP
jgi:hypothetical protein